MNGRLKGPVAAGAILLMAAALGVALYWVRLVHEPVLVQHLWLPIADGPGLTFGFLFDPLSVSMAAVVCGVTLAVMVYSLGYMAGDPGYIRYYLLLVFFAIAMLGLVLSSSLLQLLIFWELVGLASFLLIGFWFHQAGPAFAARKAFLMTRVGDVGFLLGVLLLIRALGNATIPDLLAAVGQGGAFTPRFTMVIAALLMMGVAGKSAQGPLFTWLPDAMAGPTPVSALLHSATMVAAGVYLVARLHPLFMAAPDVMRFLLWMSLITAFAAATMAMVAEDIKRVLAYSSISQLAYMLMALSAGSLAAGYFHLVTHAGFKSLLFLSAGMFIHHAHSNEMRDIAKHGGQPRAASIGLVTGSLALAGIIPFAGYFSKEAILGVLGEHGGTAALVVAYGTAGLTAYYSARMVFLTLGRRATGPLGHSTHPTLAQKAADFMMAVPVLVLSAFTLVLGWLGGWITHRLAPGTDVHNPLEIGGGAVVALSVAAAGILLAWYEYGRAGASQVGFVERMPRLRDFFGNNWYVDRFYAATFVRAAHGISSLVRWHDTTVLDGAGDRLAAGTARGGRVLARVQSGQVQMYIAIAIAIVIALAAWLLHAEGVR